MEHNSTNSHITPQELDDAARKNYALNGKIMLCSVIILVAAVFAIFCFHSYARCLLRRRRPRRLRRRNHTLRLFESGDVEAGSSAAAAPAKGLDLSVLKSLPTFAYSSAVHDPLLECAVCLSEFENGETGRVLPKCNHTFHVDCIDMWFQSHANCPLCRTPVQPGNPVPSSLQISVQTIVLVHEPVITEPEPGFGEAGSSSSSAPPPLGVSVEEPPAREAVETVKSPGGQILTLKRIWSV